MTFMQSLAICFSKYATFTGRASRSEYWWFVLFTILGSIALGIIEVTIVVATDDGLPFMNLVFILAVVVPNISALVRRLHDSNKSGWWYWIQIVPLGGILLLYWLIVKGTEGANNFGDDPLSATDHPANGDDDDDDDDDQSGRTHVPSVKR